MRNNDKYTYFPYKEKYKKRRHGKRKAKKHFFSIFILLCLLILLIFYIQKNFSVVLENLFSIQTASLNSTNSNSISNNLNNNSTAQNTLNNSTSYTLNTNQSVQESIDLTSNLQVSMSVYSKSAILMDSSTGKIMYSKNALDKMYPASTTKVMTAILTLENCSLDEIVTVSKNATLIPPTYTHAALKEGEQLSVKDLLYTLMLPSANDSAIALAEYIGGSVENFSTMMNNKAKEIGCTNTNFVNPNGIHDENHYSCAYDLALIGKYAMKNDTFREVVKTTTYELPANETMGIETRYFRTTNDLIRKSSEYYYPYCTGIKTGYTDPAENCIIASSKKDGLELIAVILGGEKTPEGKSARNIDCISLFNYGFDSYSLQTVCFANSSIKSIDIQNATPETENLNLIAKDELTALIPKDSSISDIEPVIDLRQDLKAPIQKGDNVGKVTYVIDDISYSSDLIAGSDVQPKSSLFTYLSILGVIIILMLIYKLTKK